MLKMRQEKKNLTNIKIQKLNHLPNVAVKMIKYKEKQSFSSVKRISEKASSHIILLGKFIKEIVLN